ncbi:hypothetical protein SAMN05421846_10880 [Chryseobacterium taeanense]|uniref:Uncharacterized protein n=1 Tax=Chryseobacterium taeanense TaxID=311334 RepID=A0A1G8KVN4_9FLAO|nr:hypothetical protein [Chryseobacterium taeanense]SDI47439.1 hypothetical protein SAMN05421846_10880 [Chryseobacterium taeanense]
MKHLFTAAAMLFSMTTFAQVGINNTSPKATLDITAKTTDGSKPEGLIIPQLSGSNIHTATAAGVYGTNQKGLIIYATSADSSPTGATANITAAGYYYFDGSTWQKIMTGSVTNSDLTTGVGGIYKGSGSLSGNTTVTQGSNTLAFTSTATNGFSVDGTTLSVDAANHRVGIGTSSPTQKFEITSGIANDSGMKFNNLTSSSPVSSGKALAVDANGKVVTISTSTPTAQVVAENLAPNVGSGTNKSWSIPYNHPGGLAYINIAATCWSTTGNMTSITFEIRDASNQIIQLKSVRLPAVVPVNVRISMPPIISAINLPAGAYTFYVYKSSGFSDTLIDASDVISISSLIF